MINNFKKIITLGLFSSLLLGLTFVTNAESSSSSSSQVISAPIFNTGWVINGEAKRVCWGLPEHAAWDTGSVNGISINSIYGDLMQITVPLIPSALLGVLTHRANSVRCPIICDEGYSYNSLKKSCEKNGTSANNGCAEGYTKIGDECLQNQKTVTIDATSCSNNVAPENAQYVKEEDTVNLKFDGTYTQPDCEWVCKTNYILSGSNCLSLDELQDNITLTINSYGVKNQEVLINNFEERTIFRGTIKANNFVSIDRLEIEKISGEIGNGESIDMILYVEQEEFYEKIINENSDNNIVFNNIGETSAKNSLQIEISTASQIKSEKEFGFKIKVYGTGPNGEAVTSEQIDTASIKFVEGAITVTSNAAMKLQDVVLTNKDQNLATFIVKPTNKSTTAYLDSLEFSLGDKFPVISDADDYFEVKIGDEIADKLSINGRTLTVSDINIDITADTQVTVTYKEKLTAVDNTDDASAYVLTLNNVNGKSGTSYTFKRIAVNSLVRVSSMAGNKDAETKYRFDIDYSDDAIAETITSVTFEYEKGLPAGSDETSGTGTHKTWLLVQDGKNYTVDNGTTANYVKSISWTDGDSKTVTLTYVNNNDFFKINGSNEDRLRAYAYD